MQVSASHVLSYRILEQIPAENHTLYLCGLSYSAAVSGWGTLCVHGAAIREQVKHSLIARPTFFKSHDITVTNSHLFFCTYVGYAAVMLKHECVRLSVCVCVCMSLPDRV